MVSDPPPRTTASAAVPEVPTVLPLVELLSSEVLTTLPEVLTTLVMPAPKVALRAAFVKILAPVALVPAVALVPPLPVVPDVVPLELPAPPLLEVAALLPELVPPLLVLTLLPAPPDVVLDPVAETPLLKAALVAPVPLPALELLPAPEVPAPTCAAALLTALASPWRKPPTSLWTRAGSPP